MKPTKRKTPKRQNPICNKQTPPLPLPIPSSQALRPERFPVLFPKYSLRDGTESNSDCFAGNGGHESDTDTSDKNSDSGDVTMKYTPGQPKHRALNSLHDMAYCK